MALIRNDAATELKLYSGDTGSFKIRARRASGEDWTEDDRMQLTIRGDNGQLFGSAEEVLASCAWMADAELYVNPQGIRMARGFSTEGEYPMRRYYVETDDNVVLLSIIENDRYYDKAACEEAILQAADKIQKQ